MTFGLLATLAAAVALAACGGDGGASSSSTTSTSTSTDSGAEEPAKVDVEFEEPRSGDDRFGEFMLRSAKIPMVIDSFAQGFELPPGLEVDMVSGMGGGPFYDPKTNTITFQYGFASLIPETIRQAHPDYTPYQLGKASGAVAIFILAHEFTHALIANFDLPVLGREEDAADSLASLIVLKAPGGKQYLLDTADFWIQFSKRQTNPTLSAYADTHSLDLQRAFSMACDVAGSSRQGFALVSRLGLLPRFRLRQCPLEFKQQVDSFEQVLDPHMDGPLELDGGAAGSTASTSEASTTTESTTTTEPSSTTSDDGDSMSTAEQRFREIFDAKIRRGLLSKGLSPTLADCVVAKFDETSLTEIKQNASALGRQYTRECLSSGG